METVLSPCLFVDVVKRQWTAPGLAPNPSSSDKRYFNVEPGMAKVLQTPSVDAPVAALMSSSNIPGEPEDSLRPEDKRSDQSPQGNAWAIHSATTAFFFNRATLLWLRQLEERVPRSDSRMQQNINKVVAAVQFSADTTLNSAWFAAKAMAYSVVARCLLCFRQW